MTTDTTTNITNDKIFQHQSQPLLPNMSLCPSLPTRTISHLPLKPKRLWHPSCSMKCLEQKSPTSKEVRNGSSKDLVFGLLCKPSTLLHLGAVLLPIIDQQALAVTGSNNHPEDLSWVLIQSGISAVWYFLVMPPIVLNWLRLRWYKRKFFEMYVQFMCVFLFFPGILLWAPFLNFRIFPRAPSMKYPWSTPQDASMDNLSS